MVVVHPALDVSQAVRDSGRDLCVRWGKGENELGIISIVVVGHAMSRDDKTKEPSVHREEEGTEDWALRDSSNKGTRG